MTSHPHLCRSTFTGNTARDSGGGVYQSASGSTNITNSNFNSNSAGQIGGAIALDAIEAAIDGNNFTANRAGSQGGAVSTLPGP